MGNKRNYTDIVTSQFASGETEHRSRLIRSKSNTYLTQINTPERGGLAI